MGDCKPLPFPARQPGSALGQRGVVAVGQGGHEVVGVGGAGCCFKLLACSVRAGEAEVVGDGRGEQVDVLRHDGDLPAQFGQRDGAQVEPVQGDRAAVGIPEP